MPPANSTPIIPTATTNNPETPAAVPHRDILTYAILQIQAACELEKEMIERIKALLEFCNHPPIVHHSSLGPDAHDWECSICFNSYWRPRALQDELPAAAEFPVELPCGHVFGVNCISRWLRDKITCPKCRVEVERTVDLKSQVLDKLGRREIIDRRIEDLWAISCGWGTMQRPTGIDEIRYIIANLESKTDPSGIIDVGRVLEEWERSITVREELVSNNESMILAELFSGFFSLRAPKDKITVNVLLGTLTCKYFHPGAVRLFARPRVRSAIDGERIQ
ncbi:hypothetical protein MMC31_004849 [Peltigera leucophlebia]|nr:hypothetical protein [Peltigera leucophlebia]